MTTDPVSLLRQAADRLTYTAAQADQDQWWGADEALAAIEGCRRADAEWIATCHPGIAKPLAAWLREAAEEAEQIGPSLSALRFARALLGEGR